jgi:SAM-dependent methyltransferase
MPDLNWNKAYWDGGYDWKGRGEEWSAAWGGSEAQWFGSLYPRIHRYLPAADILEIAPGFGRWTKFLMKYCGRSYCGVDMSQECISYCEEIFSAVPNAKFHINDGTSLDMVPDESVDFVFSFDSLVHAEIDVHETYVPQIIRKMRSGGVAFIHHSNWAAAGETKENRHCRGESVSADRYAEVVGKAGGQVLLQECLNWGTDKLIDAFTLFSPKGEKPIDRVRLENKRFMQEASILKDVHAAYNNL